MILICPGCKSTGNMEEFMVKYFLILMMRYSLENMIKYSGRQNYGLDQTKTIWFLNMKQGKGRFWIYNQDHGRDRDTH